ncbi:tetratricopeptide repeat protein [Chloroflexales bacterium ZM16-3]|nr:tetratricopeptide repeat protein [Chloroflexales bacterium ZM16-3]
MAAATTSCPLCAASCRVTARFCPQCGARLSAAPDPDAATSASAPPDLPTIAAADQASAGTIGKTTQRDLPPPLPPVGAFSPGSFIDPADRYRIERTLGKGGFGEAYLAHDLRLDRPCVVKRLVFGSDWPAHIREAATAAFVREAQLLVSLNTPGHAHIPEIYDFFPDSRCLVMKYIVGEDLARELKRRGAAFPLDEALQVMCEAASSLVYMHSRTPEPVLHRDIKPANLLRDSEGRVWLIDFGLAQRAVAEAKADLASGTPGYAPPEQWRGQAMPASDVYALAATLYALLTARSPQESGIGSLGQSSQALPAQARLLPDIPPALDALVRQALAPDPAARPSARAFLDLLEELRDQLRIPPPPAPTFPPDLPGFVGRAVELAALSAELDRDGMVLLTGMPGVGKTSMAVALARQVADPDTTFWHSIRPGDGAESLIWALAGFLSHQGYAGLWEMLQRARLSGTPPPPVNMQIDYVTQLLAGAGGLLLCLDDFHLVDADAQFGLLIERLAPLRHAGQLRLIVTSRRVPDFALADQVEMLTGLNAADAALLLAGRGVVLEEALQTELYAQVGGNAQLLTLAADALRRTNNPSRLVGALTGADNIERYLLDQIDAALSEEERGTMKPVAALLEPGGTRGAIESLAEGANLRRPLRSLSDRYLLETQEAAAGKEYRQHAIVRRFYYEELGKRERAELHRRAAAYYETEEPDPLRAIMHHLRAGDPDRAAHLAIKHGNEALNSGQGSALLTIMRAIDVAQIEPAQQVEFCLARGELATQLRVGEVARASFQQALDLLTEREVDQDVRVARARACRGMGELLELENPQEALEWLQRGLTELAGVDTLEEARLNRWVGATLMSLGKPVEAAAPLERSLALLPPTDLATRADVLLNLGATHCMRGNLATGADIFTQSLEFYERTGQKWATISVRQNLAQIYEISGNWSDASKEYQSALTEATQMGHVVRQVDLNLALGRLHTFQGKLDSALELLNMAQERAEHEGLLLHMLTIQSNLGDLYVRRGDIAEAEAVAQAGLDLATRLGTTDQLSEIYCIQTLLHLQGSNATDARETVAQAIQAAREIADPLSEGVSLRVQGQVFAAMGQLPEAQEAFSHSNKLLADVPYELARARAAWGAALAASDPARSQELYSQARMAFETLGAQYDLAALKEKGQ